MDATTQFVIDDLIYDVTDIIHRCTRYRGVAQIFTKIPEGGMGRGVATLGRVCMPFWVLLDFN